MTTIFQKFTAESDWQGLSYVTNSRSKAAKALWGVCLSLFILILLSLLAFTIGKYLSRPMGIDQKIETKPINLPKMYLCYRWSVYSDSKIREYNISHSLARVLQWRIEATYLVEVYPTLSMYMLPNISTYNDIISLLNSTRPEYDALRRRLGVQKFESVVEALLPTRQFYPWMKIKNAQGEVSPKRTRELTGEPIGKLLSYYEVEMGFATYVCEPVINQEGMYAVEIPVTFPKVDELYQKNANAMTKIFLHLARLVTVKDTFGNVITRIRPGTNAFVTYNIRTFVALDSGVNPCIDEDDGCDEQCAIHSIQNTFDGCRHCQSLFTKLYIDAYNGSRVMSVDKPNETLHLCDPWEFSRCNFTTVKEIRRNYKHCQSKCKPLCKQTKYSYQTISDKLEEDDFGQKKSEISRVIIEPEKGPLKYIQIQQYELMDLAEIFSDFGGYLGLFLGSSLLTVVHLIVFCFKEGLDCCCRFKPKFTLRGRKKYVAKSTAQHGNNDSTSNNTKAHTTLCQNNSLSIPLLLKAKQSNNSFETSSLAAASQTPQHLQQSTEQTLFPDLDGDPSVEIIGVYGSTLRISANELRNLLFLSKTLDGTNDTNDNNAVVVGVADRDVERGGGGGRGGGGSGGGGGGGIGGYQSDGSRPSRVVARYRLPESRLTGITTTNNISKNSPTYSILSASPSAFSLPYNHPQVSSAAYSQLHQEDNISPPHSHFHQQQQQSSVRDYAKNWTNQHGSSYLFQNQADNHRHRHQKQNDDYSRRSSMTTIVDDEQKPRDYHHILQTMNEGGGSRRRNVKPWRQISSSKLHATTRGRNCDGPSKSAAVIQNQQQQQQQQQQQRVIRSKNNNFVPVPPPLPVADDDDRDDELQRSNISNKWNDASVTSFPHPSSVGNHAASTHNEHPLFGPWSASVRPNHQQIIHRPSSKKASSASYNDEHSSSPQSTINPNYVGPAARPVRQPNNNINNNNNNNKRSTSDSDVEVLRLLGGYNNYRPSSGHQQKQTTQPSHQVTPAATSATTTTIDEREEVEGGREHYTSQQQHLKPPSSAATMAMPFQAKLTKLKSCSGRSHGLNRSNGDSPLPNQYQHHNVLPPPKNHQSPQQQNRQCSQNPTNPEDRINSSFSAATDAPMNNKMQPKNMYIRAL